MPFTDTIGWIATAIGASLGLPQLIRLARTRMVEGLSVVAWQAVLAIGVAWAAHGLKIGEPPQIVANTVGLATTIPILWLLAEQRQRPVFALLMPGLIGAVAMIAVDQAFGSAAYGVAAIIPAVIASIGQTVELIWAPHVTGVSSVFLAMAVINQIAWLAWANLVADAASVISSTTALTLTGFNLVWYALRRLGLPAVGPRSLPGDGSGRSRAKAQRKD